MQFDEVARAVEGVPYMTPTLGRRVYDHIRRTRPAEVLELGTAHGVGAAYMAAALAANGAGHLTTVDHGGAAFDPPPEQVLARAGLSDPVTIVRAHSSYDWWLAEELRRVSDANGNAKPYLDFCYLDGSKNLSVDGLAVVLVERLLRPGGWLLMDDLEWTYESNMWAAPVGDGRPFGPLSEAERKEPQLLAVFDLVVRQSPSFTQVVREDAWYGWARKAPDEPRRYEVASSRPLTALIAAELRRRVRRHRQLRRRAAH